MTVAKSAAGTGVPGSTLLYTVAATDQSGLGLGGLQWTETAWADAEALLSSALSAPLEGHPRHILPAVPISPQGRPQKQT